MLKYAVIGLGRFGSTLARQLGDYGMDVIAIDIEEEHVAEVREHVSAALRMDGTDERALREQGFDKVDVAVVGMGENFEATQLATVVLRRLGVGRVVAKSATPLHDAILLRIGAHEVISPETESAVRLAQRIISPRILDWIELAAGHSLVQLQAPTRFHGKSIGELDIRNAFGVNIVAIRKGGEAGKNGAPGKEGKAPEGELVIPRATDVIEPTDVLIVIGGEREINRLAS